MERRAHGHDDDDDAKAPAELARAMTVRDAAVDSAYAHLRSKFGPQDTRAAPLKPRASGPGDASDGTGGENANTNDQDEDEDEAAMRIDLIRHRARASEYRPHPNARLGNSNSHSSGSSSNTSLHRADSSDVAELCQYIQRLEAEKRDLVEQVEYHRDQEATHRVQLTAAARRVERADAALQAATDAGERREQQLAQLEQRLTVERERVRELTQRLEGLHRQWDETERARQHAVFQLSELQTARADAHAQRLVAAPTSGPPAAMDDRDPTTGSSERLERHKREIELLRQKLALREEQAHEKQKLAVELALRSAHLEHAALLEKVRLECEIRLSEWRHDEAVRAKEVEAAMAEDRYSIRLEMRHGMQRAEIEQRVYYLQAQAALARQQQQQQQKQERRRRPQDGPRKRSSAEEEADGDGPLDYDDDDDGAAATADASAPAFGALDEVLVRLQLELLRTRRFGALRRLALIRQGVVERATRGAFGRWHATTRQLRGCRLYAVLHMHRLVRGHRRQAARSGLLTWRAQTALARVEGQQARAVAGWNRLLGVERLCHVLERKAVSRVARAFHHWHGTTRGPGAPTRGQSEVATSALAAQETTAMGPASGNTSSSCSNSTTTTTTTTPVALEATTNGGGAELQEEIKKLHEQLASSKSEAWRYKRQLLKQFL